MRQEDVVELIKADLPDLTDGPFDVRIESDDGGSHICVYVENADDAQEILSNFFCYHGENVLVMKVHKGFLQQKP